MMFMEKSEKELRRHEIEKEIDALNIQMRSKKFDRYSDKEKAEYINKQINLFQELKSLVGFLDQIKINTMLNVLEMALRKVEVK